MQAVVLEVGVAHVVSGDAFVESSLPAIQDELRSSLLEQGIFFHRTKAGGNITKIKVQGEGGNEKYD